MATKRILATSGGFLPSDRWGVMKPGSMILEALRLTGVERPKVCFVMTASGDPANYIAMTYAAFSGHSVDVSHLALFPQPNVEIDEVLGRADMIWVGGGSVANLLALWQLHGVDEAMRDAWERGTILSGVSAGSICWHTGGPTDSFGPALQPVTNGLGLVPYGNGVHYDSEVQRRPLLHHLVGDQILPTSYATDDRVGILYEGSDPVAVLSDAPETRTPDAAAAYRVERNTDGTVTETRLAPGVIG